MSSFINKAKDKIEATLSKNDNPKSDNYGPHGSNTGNKLDPQVDSDLDGRNNPHSGAGGHGHGHSHGHAHAHESTTLGPGGIGSTGTHGSTINDPGYNHPQSTNAGPHSSNVANKFDPKVDSDRDHRNDPTSRVGGYGTQGENYGQTAGIGGTSGYGTNEPGYGGTTQGIPPTAGGYGDNTIGHTSHGGHPGHTGHPGQTGGLAAATTTGVTGSGVGSTTGTYDNPQSTNAGPHNNNLMNKLDPRHDSDRDNRNDPTSRVGGYGTQGENYGHTTGMGGTGSGATGGYGSGAVPGTTGGYDESSYTPGSGTATGTAGPHNSNLLNKLDPRVDSDMDGSKTYGGSATHR